MSSDQPRRNPPSELDNPPRKLRCLLRSAGSPQPQPSSWPQQSALALGSQHVACCSGAQQRSPAARFCFGDSSRSTDIDLLISITLMSVNVLRFRRMDSRDVSPTAQQPGPDQSGMCCSSVTTMQGARRSRRLSLSATAPRICLPRPRGAARRRCGEFRHRCGSADRTPRRCCDSGALELCALHDVRALHRG
jgi:hypothetical protein